MPRFGWLDQTPSFENPVGALPLKGRHSSNKNRDSRHHPYRQSLHTHSSFARSATRYQTSLDGRPALQASRQALQSMDASSSVSWFRSSSLTSPHGRIEFVFEYLGFVVDVVTAGFARSAACPRRLSNGQRPRPAPEPHGEVPPPTSSLMVLPLVSQRSVSSAIVHVTETRSIVARMRQNMQQ
jgi:hypothetical protein